MNIIFPECGKEAKLVKGRFILSYLQELGIEINASCGGEGKCGQCLIEVECAPGALRDKTETENKFIRDDSHRLACQARISKTDKHIYVRVPRRTYYVLEFGEYKEIPLEPLVRRTDERVSINGGEYTGALYGIALDIGTTTLAMYLIDLETGAVLSTSSRENPQTKYGNNVISRIEFARREKDTLKIEIRNVVSEMIRGLTEHQNVYDIVIVGNPVMRDLFFGYSVESLGKSPYEPESTKSVSKTAKELRLMANPRAWVYGLPLIGGFVGADALAVVLATEMYKHDEIGMAIDVGTNTEIVLGNKDRMIATSCAAGPAFEGASITCGIGGVHGAIKEVKIENGAVTYKTIGEGVAEQPVGVCGSGLIDTLAELLDNGLIDGRGKFRGAEKEFRIAKDISLSERDIDQLNLAKTAVSVGIRVLIERYGIAIGDIDRLYLAGGFVNFTNTENAIRIGLLPDIARDKIKKVGNAAIEGARQALISRTKRADAEAAAMRIEHVKLEEEDGFMEKFVGELYFQNYL